jgi:hypothetical protein
VLITDLLQYHFHAVVEFSNKYRHLLGDDDFTKVANLTQDYTGAKALFKPEKGRHDHDICFFFTMKSTVSSQRRGCMDIGPSQDANTMPYYALLEKQFFHYQCSSIKVKEESILPLSMLLYQSEGRICSETWEKAQGNDTSLYQVLGSNGHAS